MLNYNDEVNIRSDSGIAVHRASVQIDCTKPTSQFPEIIPYPLGDGISEGTVNFRLSSLQRLNDADLRHVQSVRAEHHGAVEQHFRFKLRCKQTCRGNGSTIADDLDDFENYLLKNGRTDRGSVYNPSQTIHLFHASPYNTPLDWTTPRGRYDYLPLSDHVGSVEIRRFIERVQPYLVLSGHCHESVVTGDYKVDLGETCCVNPGSQTHLDVLSLVQFDLYHPQDMKQFFIHAH